MDAIWKSKYVRILTVVLLLQAALFYTASHGDAIPLKSPLQAFPRDLGTWHTVGESQIDKDTFDVLKADEVLSRVYLQLMGDPTAPPKARVADLFVAYFSSQQNGQTPHSPRNCLPGSGWQPIETGVVPVTIPKTNQTIDINKYVIEKGGEESLVYYWFQSHGRVVASEFSEKYFMVVDSLRYHRSETSIVRVTVSVMNSDEPKAEHLATSFVQAAFPVIDHYLPM